MLKLFALIHLKRSVGKYTTMRRQLIDRVLDIDASVGRLRWIMTAIGGEECTLAHDIIPRRLLKFTLLHMQLVIGR